jgi:DNA-directed RNA polymerase I, II, and III subunit RPABC1
MVSQEVQKAVLVYQKSMTPSAQKVIQEMAPKYQVEIFQEMELIVNITKHVLVPKHEVLTDEDKKTLLAR